MIDIASILNAENVASYVEALPTAQMLGEALFPRKKQYGIDLTSIKGAKNKPVALSQSTFDTNVKVRSLKAEINEETKEMPFFKEAIILKERDRQNLLTAMSANNVQWRDLILDQVYNDVSSLVVGADIQAERMRAQLLSDGKINITSNDNEISINYGLPEKNKAVFTEPTSKWSDVENSTPVEDLETYMDFMKTEYGVTITRAIFGSAITKNLKRNVSIKNDISGNANSTTIITDAVLKDYLKSKLNLSIEIFTDKYLAEDGKEYSYYPQNKVTLLPDGPLGNTYYGTTPEEADLMAGTNAKVQVVKTGVAITTIKKEDPVTVLTKVSEVVLPSFEQIEKIFVITPQDEA